VKVGDLVMKRDGLIEDSPHYLRVGIIIDIQERWGVDGAVSEPTYRVRWADDYGVFWTGGHSLRKVEKSV
tara:strand:+ start:8110 stop:8319 length:210 start_codon:yes stop_codon:yes gene_type:complete